MASSSNHDAINTHMSKLFAVCVNINREFPNADLPIERLKLFSSVWKRVGSDKKSKICKNISTEGRRLYEKLNGVPQEEFFKNAFEELSTGDYVLFTKNRNEGPAIDISKFITTAMSVDKKSESAALQYPDTLLLEFFNVCYIAGCEELENIIVMLDEEFGVENEVEPLNPMSALVSMMHNENGEVDLKNLAPLFNSSMMPKEIGEKFNDSIEKISNCSSDEERLSAAKAMSNSVLKSLPKDMLEIMHSVISDSLSEA